MTLYMSVAWIWSNLNFVIIFFMNCCGQLSDIQESGKYKNFFFSALSDSLSLESGFGDTMRAQYIHPTESDLKASQFWHLSCSHRSHPVRAWKLEQDHRLLLIIYFKYGSHWYVEKVSPDDAASLRLMYISTSRPSISESSLIFQSQLTLWSNELWKPD